MNKWVRDWVVSVNISLCRISSITRYKDDLYFCQHYNGHSSLKSAISYARAPPHMLPSSHIMSDVAAFKRGVLQCKFDRKAAIDKSFRGQAATFDLAQDNFYLLVAWGTMDSRGQPQHHKMRTLTSKPIDFAYPPTANEIMSQNPPMSPQAPSRSRYDELIYQFEGTPIFQALFEEGLM